MYMTSITATSTKSEMAVSEKLKETRGVTRKWDY